MRRKVSLRTPTFLTSHQLYLPHSQICSMRDPIPFSVSLFAPEEVLCKYTSFRPSPESFHPMASPDVDTATYMQGYMQGQLFSCFMPTPSPVRLQLHRQTTVDVLAAGVDAAARERTDISGSKALASGVVYTASRDVNAVVWSGHIVLPPKVACGGFVARGIRVTVRSCLAVSRVWEGLRLTGAFVCDRTVWCSCSHTRARCAMTTRSFTRACPSA